MDNDELVTAKHDHKTSNTSIVDLVAIDPLSLALTLAVIGAVGGLISGFISACSSMAIGFGEYGSYFGLASILIFPFLNAVVGLISGALAAFLFNLVSKWTGGIRLVFENETDGKNGWV